MALQSVFVYEDTAICHLPRAAGAETVGEVSDLLIRCEGIQRVICTARVSRDMLVSVRTDKDAGNAAELVRAVLKDIGAGRGHQHRVGDKIPDVFHRSGGLERLNIVLRGRWLSTCHVDRQRGTRLIAKGRLLRTFDIMGLLKNNFTFLYADPSRLSAFLVT